MKFANFRILVVHTAKYISQRPIKHFKNEQRSKDAAAKKRPNTRGVGKIKNYCEDIYIATSLQQHPLATPIRCNHTHRFHPLSKIVIHTSAHPYCTEVWMTILESGWNLWVWLVGVVSRRWVWLVGGIYGYGYNI